MSGPIKSPPALLSIDHSDFDPSGAARDESELPGRLVGQIDDPITAERAAIVDPDVHGPSAPEVGDPHDRAERQRAVRGGQRMHVEALTARRALPVVRLPIPRGLPCLRTVMRGWLPLRARAGEQDRREEDRQQLDSDPVARHRVLASTMVSRQR
jgi:hypothetical protein